MRNNENTEKNSMLDVTHELLKDPKLLTGLVGLGMCVPFVFPGVTTIIPVVAATITKCGYIALGGITTYVSIDVIRDIIKK